MEKNKFNELLNEVKMLYLAYRPKSYVWDNQFGFCLTLNHTKLSSKIETNIDVYFGCLTDEEIKQVHDLMDVLEVK